MVWPTATPRAGRDAPLTLTANRPDDGVALLSRSSSKVSVRDDPSTVADWSCGACLSRKIDPFPWCPVSAFRLFPASRMTPPFSARVFGSTSTELCSPSPSTRV